MTRAPNPSAMPDRRTGQIAVIFVSTVSGDDDAGYALATARMDALATVQPGYRGMDSVANGEGRGITVSYWSDEASAIAWREHPKHRATRDAGRDRWYDRYDLSVATIGRHYDWTRA